MTNGYRAIKSSSFYLPIFGLFLFVGAGESHAQMSSSNCMAMGGGMVHCDTMSMGNSGSTVSPGGDDGSTALVLQGLGDLLGFNGEKSIRKKVGKMLADGDCIGARRYALEKGRMELASQVSQLCQPRTATVIVSAPPAPAFSGATPVTPAPMPLPAAPVANSASSQFRTSTQSPAVSPKATQGTVRRVSPSRAAPVVINDYSVPTQR